MLKANKGKCNDMNRNNKIMDEFSETIKAGNIGMIYFKV